MCKLTFTKSQIAWALLLGVMLLAIIFPLAAPAEAARATCFNGSSKGVIWDGREWHHYVQFYVDKNGAGWWVSHAPTWSSVWSYNASKQVRVGYSWPKNWWDPFPAWAFQICRN